MLVAFLACNGSFLLIFAALPWVSLGTIFIQEIASDSACTGTGAAPFDTRSFHESQNSIPHPLELLNKLHMYSHNRNSNDKLNTRLQPTCKLRPNLSRTVLTSRGTGNL